MIRSNWSYATSTRTSGFAVHLLILNDYETPQDIDAANYGWNFMKEVFKKCNKNPMVSQVVDDTGYIRARLLGQGEKKPTRKVSMNNNINQILDILNSLFEEKLNRKVGPWMTNGYSVFDIRIKPPTGHSSSSFRVARESSIRAARWFESGIRVLDVEDEGEFLVNISDHRVRDLLNLLKLEGREVNDILLITTAQ